MNLGTSSSTCQCRPGNQMIQRRKGVFVYVKSTIWRRDSIGSEPVCRNVGSRRCCRVSLVEYWASTSRFDSEGDQSITSFTTVPSTRLEHERGDAARGPCQRSSRSFRQQLWSTAQESQISQHGPEHPRDHRDLSWCSIRPSGHYPLFFWQPVLSR